MHNVLTPQLEETVFGRLYAPDARDFEHLMAAAPLLSQLRFWRHWKVGPVTDQGSKPHCVGHAWAQFLHSAPIMTRQRALPSPDHIYFEAQKNDEWPGENYAGTSVRGGARVLLASGVIREYVWADNISKLKWHLLTRGPVVAGTEWWGGMSSPRWVDNKKKRGPRDDAYLEPTGHYQGGHAYLIVGYSLVRNAYRIMNSWGTGWGEGGRAWIDADVLNHLIFAQNGEACSALEIEA